MKTWIKRSLIGLVGLVGLTAAVGALTGCGGPGHHRAGFSQMSDDDAAKLKARLVEKAGRKLDLDEAQKVKLGVLADRLREQQLALVGTVPGNPGAAGAGNLRAEWQSLVAGATFDRARAEALVQAKTGAVQSKSPAVIAAMADFYDSLRPEQQAKVRDVMARGRRG